jgi:hypothetical protein
MWKKLAKSGKKITDFRLFSRFSGRGSFRTYTVEKGLFQKNEKFVFWSIFANFCHF